MTRRSAKSVSSQGPGSGDALRAVSGKGDIGNAIAAWEEAHHALLERFRQVQADLRAQKTLDLAMASVAMRELRNIAARA